jgi:hypothetical protein
MPKGQTFLSEAEQTARGNKRHLNIVITDQDPNGNYLIVPVRTWEEGNGHQDASCVLGENSHTFIKHKSWIDYSRAKEMGYIEIFNGIHKGLLIRKEDIAPDILQNIQNGAKETHRLKDQYSAFFNYF